MVKHVAFSISADISSQRAYKVRSQSSEYKSSFRLSRATLCLTRKGVLRRTLFSKSEETIARTLRNPRAICHFSLARVSVSLAWIAYSLSLSCRTMASRGGRRLTIVIRSACLVIFRAGSARFSISKSRSAPSHGSPSHLLRFVTISQSDTSGSPKAPGFFTRFRTNVLFPAPDTPATIIRCPITRKCTNDSVKACSAVLGAGIGGP